MSLCWSLLPARPPFVRFFLLFILLLSVFFPSLALPLLPSVPGTLACGQFGCNVPKTSVLTCLAGMGVAGPRSRLRKADGGSDVVPRGHTQGLSPTSCT
eukprot:3713075-Rhodomonas_salina.3